MLLDILHAWSYYNRRYINNLRSEPSRRSPVEKNFLHGDESNVQVTDSSSSFNVQVIGCPESNQSFKDLFLNSESWGRNPILIREVFKTDADVLLQTQTNMTFIEQMQHRQKSSWPTWEDIKQMASREDAESRWITHTANDDSSWSLDLGPFDPEDVDEALSDIQNEKAKLDDPFDDSIRSTLIVNDVDRFSPPLFDWINDKFSFIPLWRRDDGQVSLAHEGGGIGPHVDEYDVFLIQMAGIRRWSLGNRFISVVEELGGDLLVKDLDVRIIRNWDIEKGKEFILYPGDVLYLPPRIAHCGTAQSDGCMTLSVGLRAPSARELINQIAEYSSSCFTSHELAKRYNDCSSIHNYLSNHKENEISQTTRDEMKRLVRDSIDQILENDFDEILGKFLTEPKRLRANFPLPFDLDENIVDSQLNVVLNEGRGSLHSCNSICFAFSTVDINSSKKCHLFVDGNKWEVESDGSDQREKEVWMLKTISSAKRLSRNSFVDEGKYPDGSIPVRIVQILKDLIAKGYLKLDV